MLLAVGLALSATAAAAPLPPSIPPAAGRSCLGAPADWAAACEANDLLFEPHDCALCVMPANRRPEIGNGYLAIQMAAEENLNPAKPKMPTTPSGPLYLAGVFNGCATKGTCKMNPSQRAAISPPLPMHVAGKGMKAMAALDLVEASYARRYTGGDDSYDAQLRMYAHRSRRSLLVTEVTATSTTTVAAEAHAAIEVQLSGSFGATPSGDSFTWTVSTKPCATGVCTIWSGVTLEAEVSFGSLVTVAWVHPHAIYP